MQTTDVLTLQGLKKTFGGHTAVDGLDLSVHAGEILGFLGPNGAGKTTTIKIIAGLLRPDCGAVIIRGRNLHEEPLICKQDTGYVPDRPWLFDKLTGREYLQFVASLYHLPPQRFESESRRYLHLFDLDRRQDHLIEGYSHGMRQKLVMTSVFMLDQPLLLIDEPMVGLDPRAARVVKELLRHKAEQGTAILLSTHSLEIAEELCSTIAIIDQGRLLACGTMETLRSQACHSQSSLEDLFLELTGSQELQPVIAALKQQP